MSLLRIIARLDIKGENVIKGVQFEGLRIIGKPEDLARKYASEGADEIIYIDTVASLYGQNHLAGLIERTTEDVFVPITVGGGIKGLADAKGFLERGADKVSINTHAMRNPEIISEISRVMGSQGMVASVEAKRVPGGWEAYTDCGRERTGRDAVQWAREAVERGAGEILLTSIDRDGTLSGPDLDLIRALRDLPVPLTYGGGIGCLSHARMALDSGADALAIGAGLHYGKVRLEELASLRPLLSCI